MKSLIYFLVQYYPFWALPLAWIFFEMSGNQRRRSNVGMFFLYIGFCVVLVALVGLYFYAGGYSSVVPALHNLEIKYF